MNNKESITELHQKWFGRIIANRYRVSSILGAGGMGIVLIAEQESLNRHVAIKLIHAHLAQTKEVKTRFKQEAPSCGTN